MRAWWQRHSLLVLWLGYVLAANLSWLVTGAWAGKEPPEMANTWAQEQLGQAVGTFLLMQLTKRARDEGSSESK